jgi:hypothetical protein
MKPESHGPLSWPNSPHRLAFQKWPTENAAFKNVQIINRAEEFFGF